MNLSRDDRELLEDIGQRRIYRTASDAWRNYPTNTMHGFPCQRVSRKRLDKLFAAGLILLASDGFYDLTDNDRAELPVAVA